MKSPEEIFASMDSFSSERDWRQAMYGVRLAVREAWQDADAATADYFRRREPSSGAWASMETGVREAIRERLKDYLT